MSTLLNTLSFRSRMQCFRAIESRAFKFALRRWPELLVAISTVGMVYLFWSSWTH